MCSHRFRFVFNCVPQTNGILLGAGTSVAYFVLSLLSLLGLASSYFAVADGLKQIVWWAALSKLLYGLVLLILGIVVLAVESSQLKENVTNSWKAMSEYQKMFFDND